MIEGSKRPDEYIIYSAHWDLFRVGQPIDGDSIYNGTHDNASGLTGMLVAEAFSKLDQKPERSIVFLFVTAEDSKGLLGSAYYGQNPIYPPTGTVANINMDGLPADVVK